MDVTSRSHGWDGRVVRLIAAVVIFSVIAAPSATAGEFDSLRKAVRDPNPPPPVAKAPKPKKQNHGHGSHCHCHDCCDNDDDGLEATAVAFLGMVIGGAITSPWWGPVVVLEDDYDVEGYFSERPYKGQAEGYMMIHPWLPEGPRTVSARASVEYANSFDDLNNVTSKFLIESNSRWGIDSEITYRSEELGLGQRDELLTGDLNFVFRFAQSPHAQFRTGLGFNWLADDIDDNFGINFTYGFDLYPAKPWVFSNELDWGRLGDSHLIHVRSTIGYQIHQGEIYIGVDHFDAGPLEMTTMVSGVRVWF